MDATTSGYNDARLQEELVVLQQQLRRARATLTTARRLRESIRELDAACSGRLAYPSAADDGFSSVDAQLQQLRADVQRLADVFDAEVLARQRQRIKQRVLRRVSVKSEAEDLAMAEPEPEPEPAQATADYDTDATVDELFVMDMDMDEPSENTCEAVVGSPGCLHEAKVVVAITGAGEPVHSQDITSQPPEVKPVETLEQFVVRCVALAEDQDSWTKDAANSLKQLLEMLNVSILAIDGKFRKAGTPVPRLELLEPVSRACERAMDQLVQGDATVAVVQPMLRLHKTMADVKHADLVVALYSHKKILSGVISSLAETVGGMKRACQSAKRDSIGQDCFTLAVELLTTDCNRRRDALVGETLGALKSGFKVSIALRTIKVKGKSNSKTSIKSLHAEPQKTNTKSNSRSYRYTIAWAGRVMLLAAQIVAYVIATESHSKIERFLRIVQLIGVRHAAFQPLFERSREVVLKASTKQEPTEPLNLQHESQRVLETCVFVCRSLAVE